MVSVRWKVYGVSVCVVNSHLAAHAQFNKERIESYNNVLGSHTFKNKETEMILYHEYGLSLLSVLEISSRFQLRLLDGRPQLQTGGGPQ